MTGRLLVTLLLAAAGLLGSGCAESKDQLRIREGLLVVRLSQKAFLAEWGVPERTASVASEEDMRVRWGPGGGGFFKGKRPLDVWIYERRGVELVFDHGHLVAWRTDKNVEQLRSSPRR